MKLNKKYLAPLCSLFLTGALLISIVVLLGRSYGWFARNEKTSAAGLSVSAVSSYKTEQGLYTLGNSGTLVPLNSETAASLFSDLVPGESVTVYLRIFNSEDIALNTTLLLSAPTALTDSAVRTDETDPNYYYFGSQIRVKSILPCNQNGVVAGGNDQDLRIVQGKEAFLLTLPDSFYTGDVTKDTVKQGVGTATAYDFSTASPKQLTNDIEIAAGATVYFAITFEFAENDQVQNPYINFGVADANSQGTLSRQLLCSYMETE
jgi:hypothetical protein